MRAVCQVFYIPGIAKRRVFTEHRHFPQFLLGLEPLTKNLCPFLVANVERETEGEHIVMLV